MEDINTPTHWATERVSALEHAGTSYPSLEILAKSLGRFKIKAASKLGDYSQTRAFEAGTAEIAHATARIRDAYVFMPNGFILTNKRYLVEESLWQSAIHKRKDVAISKSTEWKHVIKKPRQDEVYYVRQDGILLAHHRFYHQYFHWFIDCLPRLWVAGRQNIQYSSFYCGEFQENSFQQKSINFLGIRKHRLSFGVSDKALQFGSLLYPFSTLNESLRVRPSFRDGIHHKGGWDPEYLKELNDRTTSIVASKSASRGKRLYIRRPDSGHRRLVNAASFEEFLAEIGFSVVDPGKHSFEAQIQIFNDAEYIVASHGAGLTNLLWANPKKLKGVFEITVEGINDTGYTFISNGLGFRHYVFPAIPGEHRHGAAFADLYFNNYNAIKAIKSMLQE